MHIDEHLIRAETQRRTVHATGLFHAVAVAEHRRARRGRVVARLRAVARPAESARRALRRGDAVVLAPDA